MIVCENLVKIYTQTGVDVVALQGLDLQVAPGEMIAIVGESGSGKSTLLNMLGGLDRPTAGKVTVAGQDLQNISEKELDYYCLQLYPEGEKMVSANWLDRVKFAFVTDILDQVFMIEGSLPSAAVENDGQIEVLVALDLANALDLSPGKNFILYVASSRD